jgi:hypothetical protein
MPAHGPAWAAVIQRDWKTPGDGLLTYDDVNRREWLDLSQTTLSQFPGSNLEQRYQSVVSQLAVGGLFEGFNVADRENVVALAQSAGINPDTDDFGANGTAVSQLITLLSPLLGAPPGISVLQGFLDDVTTHAPPQRLIATLHYDPPNEAQYGWWISAVS